MREFKYRALISLICALSGHAMANPTGGSVAGGSASIGGQGTSTVTVNQTSNTAVINWGTFSINSGELTKFVQPNSNSAVLNRVLGGSTSQINGTLSANGQVFLINGNGIIIGAGGVVNAAGFTASTRDISDSDFLSGNYHFSGSSNAGVQNFGTINALGGDAILIGKTVDNQGKINAPNGTVGLAAADDVLITQSGEQHVFVNPSASASSATSQVGVSNSGTIAGAAAELRAANGNIYALAINNSGTVRAKGVTSQNGHVYLVADKGVTANTGTLHAENANGKGGHIETSGGKIAIDGDITTGKGGSWLIDPPDVTISKNGADPITTTIIAGQPVYTFDGPDIKSSTLENALRQTDVTISTANGNLQPNSGNISVNSTISWSSNSTLTLQAVATQDPIPGGNIFINAAITGTKGGLILDATNNVSASAAVQVGSFILASGNWQQIVGSGGLNKLPIFTVKTDFEVLSGAVFQRFNGGDGSSGSPFVVSDVYGLQGIGSSAALMMDNYIMGNAINAVTTATWNDNEGFIPFTDFQGTFDGNNTRITTLTINVPGSLAANPTGLFGLINTTGVVKNLNIAKLSLTGTQMIGGIAGENFGLIENCSVTGIITGKSPNNDALEFVGGIAGFSTGTISNCTNSAAINLTASPGGYFTFQSGGLVGQNGGNIDSSTNFGTITVSPVGQASGALVDGLGGLVGHNQTSGFVNTSVNKGTIIVKGGGTSVGGMVGDNEGEVTNSSNVGSVTTGNLSTNVGGGVGWNENYVYNSFNTGSVKNGNFGSNIGGLVGENDGFIDVVYNTGAVTTGTDNDYVGGLIGYQNFGEVDYGYNTGAVKAGANTVCAGGLVGWNHQGIIYYSYNTGSVTTGTDSQYLGGGAGYSDNGLIEFSYSTGKVTGNLRNFYAGGLVGYSTGADYITQSYATGAVSVGITVGGINGVGGLVGYNDTNATMDNSYATGAVSVTGTGNAQLGGLVGYNANMNGGAITNTYSTGKVSGKGAGVTLGGLVGQSGDVNSITSSYWDTQTSGLSGSSGGTGETTIAMGQQATFSGWDFGSIWTIAAKTAPYFQSTGGPNNTPNYGGPLPKP